MDKEMFIQRVVPMQAPMRLLAERILKDEDEAADAVQETFAMLWQQHKKLDGIANVEGYCMRTLRYRCVDVLRKRLPMQSLDEEMEISDEAILEESRRLEERSQKAEQLLSELSDRERELVTLRYIEALPTEQIAQRLKLTDSNIYTILSRAIHKMKERSKEI